MAEEIVMSSLPDCLPPPLPTVPIVPASTRPPRTWYFLGTTIFALIAYGVKILIGVATFILLFFIYDVPPTAQPQELLALMKQGGRMALALIAAAPFTVATLWIAIRIARQEFSDYLALIWPRRIEIAKALAATAVVLLIWFVIGYLRGETAPAFAIESYKTAKDAGWLDVYVIALCIAAPISEEFAVRGFLFRVVAILPRPGWRHRAFVGGLGGHAHAVQPVLHRGNLHHRPLVRLFPPPQRFDLADGRGARFRQSRQHHRGRADRRL
jgi:membrane protease YdiL (CAAX protease family)